MIKKRKLFIANLVLLCGLLGGCGKVETHDENIIKIYNQYVENGGTLSYDEWLASIKGDKGEDGVSVVSITKTSSEGNVDTYTISYSNGKTSTFTVTNGVDGAQGIQGEKGEDGHTPVITIGENGNWFIDGVDSNVSAQGEKGDDGVSVVSITKTSSEGNVDTYTIIYSDGKTSTFTVTNGVDGAQGIQGEQGEDGHTPVITIGENGNWFIDGVDSNVSAQGEKGDDGVSVVSITKTSSEGNVDTYTIIYSDGKTSTFTVTNGVDGAEGIQGEKGEDGHTPVITIGENGNWIIDGVDSGCTSKGDKGEDGSSFLSGEGVPSSETGKDGDVYLDNSTGLLYKKVSGKWDIIAALALKSKVTLHLDGGTYGEISDEYINYFNEGSRYYLPIPEKSAHEFMGWYLDSSYVNNVNEDYVTVEGDIDIYAKWEYVGSYSISDFTYSETSDGYEIQSYKGSSSNAVIPAYISGKKVVVIANFAFANNTTITSIHLPHTLRTIGKQAFYKCSNLASVEIPGSVTSFSGVGAFYGCSTLKSVTLPDTLTSLPGYTFYGCTSLSSITLPKSLKSMGQKEFFNAGIKEIEIPSSVSSIPDSCFEGCTSLEKVVLNEGLTTIGTRAFFGCSSLINMNLPSTLTTINNAVFYKCFKDVEITIPASITSLGNSFYGSLVKKVTFEEGSKITTLESSVFGDCTNLSSITLPSGLVELKGNYTFNNCKSLTSIVIPETVTSISNSCFLNCTGITSIVIPSGVTTIGYDAFSGWTSSQTINFEVSEKQSGFNSRYLDDCNANIVWGYTA